MHMMTTTQQNGDLSCFYWTTSQFLFKNKPYMNNGNMFCYTANKYKDIWPSNSYVPVKTSCTSFIPLYCDIALKSSGKASH